MNPKDSKFKRSEPSKFYWLKTVVKFSALSSFTRLDSQVSAAIIVNEVMLRDIPETNTALDVNVDVNVMLDSN